jgi:hypothetical protein
VEAIMEKDETPLETAQRHALAAQAQIAWIAELNRLRDDATAAKAVLADLEDQLLNRCATLVLEQAKAARRQT